MNLFCVIPAPDDATSFYRALQPLAQLRRLMPNLKLTHHKKDITTSDIADQDVAFIQRPDSAEHLKLIDLCKTLKVKVWVDYDDNLFCVPPSNPAHLQCERAKPIFKEVLEKADIVSVSTEQLGRDLKTEVPSVKKIRVIPNAFNDYLFTDKPVFRPHPVVMWRGTQSHQEDLMQFAPHILEAAKHNPQWFFNFVGYNPFFLVNPLGKQSAHTQGMDIFKYHEYIKMIYPNICIVTLSDSKFNRSKSNIAWIESTYAGAVTIGPNWEEWQKPGIVTYNGLEGFKRALNSLIQQHGTTLINAHAMSWEYIETHLRLSRINQMREELLEEVMG